MFAGDIIGCPTGRKEGSWLRGAEVDRLSLGQPETLVAKRIDTASTALFAHSSVDELSDLDLSYSPPLNSPWDPLQSSAQAWLKRVGPVDQHRTYG